MNIKSQISNCNNFNVTPLALAQKGLEIVDLYSSGKTGEIFKKLLKINRATLN